MTVSSVSASTIAALNSGLIASSGVNSDQIQQLSSILNDTSGAYSTADQINAWRSLIGVIAAPDYAHRSLSDRQTVAQAVAHSAFGARVVALQGQLDASGSDTNVADQAQGQLNAFQSLSSTDQQIAFGTSGLANLQSGGSYGFSAIGDYVAYLKGVSAGLSPDATLGSTASVNGVEASLGFSTSSVTVSLSPTAQSLSGAASSNSSLTLVQQVAANATANGSDPIQALIAVVNNTDGTYSVSDQVTAWLSLGSYITGGDGNASRSAWITANGVNGNEQIASLSAADQKAVWQTMLSSPLSQQINAAADKVTNAGSYGAGLSTFNGLSSQDQQVFFLAYQKPLGYASISDYQANLQVLSQLDSLTKKDLANGTFTYAESTSQIQDPVLRQLYQLTETMDPKSPAFTTAAQKILSLSPTATSISASAGAAASGSSGTALLTPDQIQKLSDIVTNPDGKSTLAEQAQAWNALGYYAVYDHSGPRSEAVQNALQAAWNSPIGQQISGLQVSFQQAIAAGNSDSGRARAQLNWFNNLSPIQQQIWYQGNIQTGFNNNNYASISDYAASLAANVTANEGTSPAPATASSTAQSILFGSTSSSATPSSDDIALQTLQAVLKSLQHARMKAEANGAFASTNDPNTPPPLAEGSLVITATA